MTAPADPQHPPDPAPAAVWEERFHPLREEWVVVAAHRQHRPWGGETVPARGAAGAAPAPRHAPDCYLCPGNARVSGARNPPYDGIFVFDNDHPCVGPAAPAPAPSVAPVFRSRRADGLARVVCYSPRHDLSLSRLPVPDVAALLAAWQQQTRELGARPEVDHVLVFENRGEVVGVSNPHPHGQIYATNFVFKTIETEARASARHLTETGRVLFQDVLRAEREDGRRLLVETDGAVAFVPYFARYAYEAYVAPLATHARIDTLSPAEIDALAAALKRLLVQYDNLWQLPFPYVLALHQAPTDGNRHPGFHFHIELHPPLRRPNLLKYLAGPEIGGGNFLADTSPEAKAAELRAQPEGHYQGDGG
jgi:UDPglucose--hexose-1-phosphate uridylyltransferase